LGAVDLVAENPSAGRAMRIHPAAAIVAATAGRDARDQDAIAGPERAHAAADGFDDADTLVAENPAGRAGRHVALEDVKIGPADRGAGHADDRIACVRKLGPGSVLEGFLARAPVDECLHYQSPACRHAAAHEGAMEATRASTNWYSS